MLGTRNRLPVAATSRLSTIILLCGSLSLWWCHNESRPWEKPHSVKTLDTWHRLSAPPLLFLALPTGGMDQVKSQQTSTTAAMVGNVNLTPQAEFNTFVTVRNTISRGPLNANVTWCLVTREEYLVYWAISIDWPEMNKEEEEWEQPLLHLRRGGSTN